MQDVGNMPEVARPQRRTWPWAAGSIVAVLVILAATLIGRQFAANRRATGYLVAPPSLPTLDVLGVTPAGRSLRLAALDPATDHLLALTSAPTRQCPQGVSCIASPTPDTLAVYDGATGQPLASRQLVANDPLTYAQFLVVDGKRGVAYAISPPGEGTTATLYALSSSIGEAMGERTLPLAVSASLSGAALVPLNGDLALVAGNQLLLLDPATGAITGQQVITPAGDSNVAVDGPLVNPSGTTIALVARDSSGTSLRTFDARSLQPLATRPLPNGTRLGDYDAASGVFALIGPGGDVSTMTTDAATSPGGAPQAFQGVTGAQAVAWDSARHWLVVAHTGDVTVYDAQSGQPLAALPITAAVKDAAAPASRALLVAPGDGRLLIRDATGQMVIARDVGATRRAAGAGTALLLARSAMTRFLPEPKQTPAFVAATSFPAGAGSGPRDYYIHFSDRGWQAFPNGSIASGVSATTRERAVYQITFTISWYQLFQHTHTWTCLVMADGSVRLSAESGDALP